MRLSGESEPSAVPDALCDVCGESTRVGGEFQFATLQASWREGSEHSGEDYELHLCERCFFTQVAGMKRMRWLGCMFEDAGDSLLQNESYGRVWKASRDDAKDEE
ncbi:hypothetical protein E4L40_26530 [Pseudomonas putida]|nr:hypothetical protein E4L40_26530 [Pseudomonas putida]